MPADLLAILPLLLATGVVAGMMAGLLGLGGGLVVVPALFWILRWHGIAPDAAMQVAVASSLATMVLTTAAAVRTHWRQGTTRRDLLPWLLPGVALGAVLAPLLVARVPAGLLAGLFSAFMFVVAVRMVLPHRPSSGHRRARPVELFVGGVGVALLSAMLGVGGGLLIVPWLQWRGLAMVQAVAVSVTTVLVVGLIASCVYALMGTASTVPLTLGLVQWPSVLAIATTSMLFAPLGSRLARRLPDRRLRRVFAGVLLVVGLTMLL